MKKSAAILSLCPDAEFVIRGSGIDGVVEWINPSVPPVSEEQIRAEYDRLVSGEPLRIAQGNRSEAYKAEADPLFFKAQRGEATMAEWQAKVEEIRNRFPYPG